MKQMSGEHLFVHPLVDDNIDGFPAGTIIQLAEDVIGEMSPEMVVNFDSVRVLAGDAGCVVVVVVVVVGRFVVDDDTGAVVGDAAPDAR